MKSSITQIGKARSARLPTDDARGCHGSVGHGAANVAAADNGFNPSIHCLNPDIAPINSKPYGRSYSNGPRLGCSGSSGFPPRTIPVLDTTGENADVGQEGPVWFLAGNLGGITVRECAVPEGKALFFPILNEFSDNNAGDPPSTTDQLRAIVRPPWTRPSSPVRLTANRCGTCEAIARTPRFSQPRCRKEIYSWGMVSRRAIMRHVWTTATICF